MAHVQKAPSAKTLIHSTRAEKSTSTYGLIDTNRVEKSTSTCGQDSTWLEKETQLTRKIKDLEKDLKLKEQKLADAAKQLATSRAYIVTLEHRLEEKMCSDEIQARAAKEKGPNKTYNQTSSEVMNTRMQAMESRMQAVETHIQNIRMTTLEEKLKEMENHIPKSKNNTDSETNTQSFLSQGRQTEKPPWNESSEQLKRPQKRRQMSKKKSQKLTSEVHTTQERVTQPVPTYTGGATGTVQGLWTQIVPPPPTQLYNQQMAQSAPAQPYQRIMVPPTQLQLCRQQTVPTVPQPLYPQPHLNQIGQQTQTVRTWMIH